MNDLEYYDIKFTPTIGCFYLNIMFSEFDDEYIPLYKAFLIFPLFTDDSFLDYILTRTKTFDFHKLITDYIYSRKANDFWIKYNIKYLSTRRYCFDSIYFGIMIDAFELTDYGIRNKRILIKEIPLEFGSKYSAIKKIGTVIKSLELNELFRVLKVGEKND